MSRVGAGHGPRPGLDTPTRIGRTYGPRPTRRRRPRCPADGEGDADRRGPGDQVENAAITRPLDGPGQPVAPTVSWAQADLVELGRAPGMRASSVVFAGRGVILPRPQPPELDP